MAKFTIDLSGDSELVERIAGLSSALNGWMINRAFKPAIRLFAPPILAFPFKETKSGQLPNSGFLKSHPIKRSRVMKGQMLTSMFGTQESGNNPYYGAFVNYGHKFGPRPSKSDKARHGDYRKQAKPVRFMDKVFDEQKDAAASLAVNGLALEVELAWARNQFSGSDD